MRRVWSILCVLMVALAAAPAAPAEPTLAVIVHPARATALGLQDVARIYLGQRRFWEGGEAIVAINRESGGAAREHFSERALGQTSQQFAAYWNEQYFHGIFPPATLTSSAAVKRYVATNRNAIGYIEASDVDDSVRVVLRIP